MNRRILALLLALVMVAGLMTGCASGKQEAAAPETAQTESPAAEETAAEPDQTEESPAEEEAPAEPETVSFTDTRQNRRAPGRYHPHRAQRRRRNDDPRRDCPGVHGHHQRCPE